MQFSLTRLPAHTLIALRRTVTLDALPGFLEEAFSLLGPEAGKEASACRAYYHEVDPIGPLEPIDVSGGFVVERALAEAFAARIGDAVVENYPETAVVTYGPPRSMRNWAPARSRLRPS